MITDELRQLTDGMSGCRENARLFKMRPRPKYHRSYRVVNAQIYRMYKKKLKNLRAIITT